MEIFRDNYKPVQIPIQDNDGKEHINNTKILTIKKMKQIEKLRERAAKADTDITATELMYSTMEMMFDKPKEFWDEFSISFLNQIVEYASEQMSKKKEQQMKN